jgi:hypothetical protein
MQTPVDLWGRLDHPGAPAEQVQAADPRRQLTGAQPRVGREADQRRIPMVDRLGQGLDLLGIEELHLGALHLGQLHANGHVAAQPATPTAEAST